MKKGFVIAFILLSKSIYGQDNDYVEHRVYLKFAPVALLDPWNGPTVKIGTEINNEGGNAIYFELGTFFSDKTTHLNNKGILARTEFKHYIDGEYTNCGAYLSLELFYKHQSYQTHDSIELTPNYRKDYSLNKNVAALTFKLGYMAPLGSTFNLEIFLGLGVRIKNATSTLTADENDHIKAVADYGPNQLANVAGHFVLPNVLVGMKFAFGLDKAR